MFIKNIWKSWGEKGDNFNNFKKRKKKPERIRERVVRPARAINRGYEDIMVKAEPRLIPNWYTVDRWKGKEIGLRTVNILVGWRKSGGQALVMKLNFKRHVHTLSPRLRTHYQLRRVSVFFAPSSSPPRPPPLRLFYAYFNSVVRGESGGELNRKPLPTGSWNYIVPS